MRRLILASVLGVTACGTGTTDFTESSTTSSTTTTTVTSSPTTTTTTTATATATEPTGIEPLTRFTRLEPGVRYLHSGWPGQIVTPFMIQVGLPGWRVDEIGMGFIQFRNGQNDPGIRAAVVAFMPNESVAAIIENLTSPDRVVDSTEPEPFPAGELAGMTVDVSVLEDPGNLASPPNLLPGDPACMLEGLLFEEGTGQEQSWFQILAGCAWNRVWVVDVDELRMTLTVSPDILSREAINELSELGPYPDDFINAITFCTGATPCDG